MEYFITDNPIVFFDESSILLERISDYQYILPGEEQIVYKKGTYVRLTLFLFMSILGNICWKFATKNMNTFSFVTMFEELPKMIKTY